MKSLFAAIVVFVGFTGLAAAQAPVAVVEDVQGKVTGAEFMDYVAPGTVIKLGPAGKVQCDSGHSQLVDRQVRESAATVVRSIGDDVSMMPQVTLYGLSPVVETTGRGKLVVERLDVAGERYDVNLTAASVVRGKFYDFAKAKTSLKPGGTYAASLGSQKTVFRVDHGAEPGPTPIIVRLVRLK